QDVRYAFRTLARSPGFTAVGVLVLALAIGVNTAIFSLVNALIFVRLPVPDAEELRFIYPFDPNAQRNALPAAHYEFDALRRSDPALADLVGYWPDSINAVSEGHLRTFRGERVTANYFDVLRITPQLGRTFRPDDDAAGAAPVAIISDGMWRREFQADPNVLGRTLDFDLLGYSISGVLRRYTIIAVAPPGFDGVANRFQPTEYWMPRIPRIVDGQHAQLHMDPTHQPGPVRHAYNSMFFRKPGGVSDEQLELVVGAMGRRFGTQRRCQERAWTLQVHQSKRNQLPFDRTGRIVPTRLAAGLMATAAAVVLIALANLAGLLAARSLTRRAEMAVRTTLGAGTWRLTRQLLVESVLLAIAGGVLGLLGARTLVSVFVAAVPRFTPGGRLGPPIVDVPLDWRVLAFTAATCIAAAVVVSLAPVRQALSRDLLHGLSEGAASIGGRSRSRLRGWVLLPQVCGSLVLLVVAALLVRGVIKEQLADPGYTADDVVVLDYEFEWRARGYFQMTPEQKRQVFEPGRIANAKLLNYLREIPGLTSAAVTWTSPGGVPLPRSGGFVIDRDTYGANPVRHGTLTFGVSTGYFETLGIRVTAGRPFDLQDQQESAPPVAIVSESLAWRLWGSPNAVGRHIAFRNDTIGGPPPPPRWMEVVGVVPDLSLPLTEGARTSVVYTPAVAGGNTIVARGDVSPAVLVGHLKDAVLRADPKAHVSQPRMMHETVDALLFPRRAAAAIIGGSGLAGLLLACIGLYGVVSYSVAQRVREIGIRSALGADRRDIMRLILRDGIKVIAIGTALGGALAFSAIRLTSAKVVALPAADAVTLSLAPLILALAMLAATYIPARRAAAVDPMIALRRL
ncbi:MAG: ADOP family duplicated permease, partial [Vicinamibacterales bacterium]